MKLKQILLVCGLSFAMLLVGCGSSRVNEPNADGNDMQDNTQVESEINETTELSEDAKALSTYREILKSAPAITGEHDELNDATFDYEQNLEKFGKHRDMFAILDINKDGIPELITQTIVNFRWNIMSVFTYVDGKAVLVKDHEIDLYLDGSFEQNSGANGAYTTYICEENHIHSVWKGTNPMGDATTENTAYLIDGANLVKTDCAITEGENTVDFQEIAKANTDENVAQIVK